MSALSRIIRFPSVTLPEIDKVGNSAELVATELRRLWEIRDDSPVGSICRLIERAGIIVFFHRIVSERVDACSHFGKIPAILVTKDNRGTSRLTYDLAHELGELVFRRKGRTDVEHEKLVNSFAGHFLMPRKGFERHFTNKPLTLSHLLELKNVWRVSLSAVLQQALSLGLLSPDVFVIWKRKLAARGWARVEPSEPVFNGPEALRDSVKMAANMGLSLSELAAFVDIEETRLQQFFYANGIAFPLVLNSGSSKSLPAVLGDRPPFSELKLVQPSLLPSDE